MKRANTFRIVRHGAEFSDYFRGHGVAFTNYTDTATGNGFTEAEALNEALEMLAEEWDVAALEALPEFQEEARYCTEKLPEDDSDGEHTLWFWVSVDVA